MANIIDKAKDKMHDAENKAHELKGRVEQKHKDMKAKKTDTQHPAY